MNLAKDILRHARCRPSGQLLCLMVSFAVAITDVSNAADDPPESPRPAQIREEQGTLPKYQDLELPSAEDLLRSKPYDWIVLKTQEVLFVEPVVPRPDPIGRITIKYEQAQKTYNRILKHRPYKEAELASLRTYYKNAGRDEEFNQRETDTKQELDTARERMDSLKPTTYKLPVTLNDGSLDPEFLLEIRYIDFVVHYEDMLLRRAEQLIDEGRIPLAYDLLLLVARRHRDNNARIRSEFEAEERSLVSAIERLEAELTGLRSNRDELNMPRNKNLPASKLRLSVLEKTVVAIALEIKDVDEELRGVRYKLRFVRPKDFPNPDPPRKDDLLLPSWPKFDEAYQRLVVKDAEQHLGRGEFEETLWLLEELGKSAAGVPRVSDLLERAVDQLIAPLMERQDFRQVRHFLGRLSSRVPSSSIVQKWEGALKEKGAAVLADARVVAASGDARLAARTADQAARIWPEIAGLKETHRELTESYQILRVGVLHLPGEVANPAYPLEADERARRLTASTLFEPASISDQGVRYRSSYFESWEPTDLGRQVQFRLKLDRAPWESRPLVTSADVFAELSSRVHPESPRYDERLAGFVEGMSIQSPSEFTVRFRQFPLRPEALWQITVGVGDASRSLNQDLSTANETELGRERFHQVPSDQSSSDPAKRAAVFRRVRSQPSAARRRNVDEIVELRYDSWDHALQGLVRGDVSYVSQVGLQDVKALRDDGRFFVVPYALPRSHFLQFHPQSAPLRDGQLRRALMHAIPREHLLKDVVLKDTPNSHGRLVTGPFATKGYGDNRTLEQPQYDPLLAAALALTAKKRLGGQIPSLRLWCPDDAVAREVSLAMIEDWRRVGVEVQLLDGSTPTVPWDICYRTAKCIEPLFDVWPLLTLQVEARIDALQSLSEATRRRLLELERMVDWTNARKQLHRLLSEELIEARYIPLWEIDEFAVARRHVVGLPSPMMHTYDDVERWTVQSWYPQDQP